MKNLKMSQKKGHFKELVEHVKTDNPYAEPIVQDAKTIEKDTQKRMMNLLNLL